MNDIKFLNYLFIFFGNITQISLNTIYLALAPIGNKIIVSLINGTVNLIYVLVLAMTVTNIEKEPVKILIYSAGSALGALIGMHINDKLTISKVLLTIVVPEEYRNTLHKNLCINGFTNDICLVAKGKDKKRSVFKLVIRKNEKNTITTIVNNILSDAMIITENLRI